MWVMVVLTELLKLGVCLLSPFVVSILFNAEFIWQNGNALSKSHPQNCHWAFVWVINMPFQSRLWAKCTQNFSFFTHSSLEHQKAKLQAPQNPCKHDKVDANKFGQRTDFPGPIIAENLLRNSWLSPEVKWWRRLSYVITRPGCHKCLNVHQSDQSLRFYSLTTTLSHTSSPQNNTFAPHQRGPPCPQPGLGCCVFKRKTHLNYNSPGTELLFH